LTIVAKEDRQRRRSCDIDDMVEQIVAEAHAPIGAYAIAKTAKKQGYLLVPSQVYRALSHLIESDRVERIVSANAFVMASESERVHLLCESCTDHDFADGTQVSASLKSLCSGARFEMRSMHVELNGRCAMCHTGQNQPM